MASNYPTSLDSFSTSHADGVGEVVHASTINDNSDAINKIEAELGTLPKGTYSSVKTRFDAIQTPTFNLQTGTSYTLVLADASKVVSMNNAAANTVLIPTDASVAFPNGTQITLRQAGAGQTSVGLVNGATTSVNSRGAIFNIAGQFGYATLIKVSTNTWELTGDLV